MGAIHFLWAAFTTSVAIYAIYAVSTAIYNITFHPLAKFPGRKVHGAFKLPWHWHQIIGDSPQTVKSLHDKYGDMVRIAPNMLSFNYSQAWRDVYGHRKGRKDLERDPNIFRPAPGEAPNVIVSNDADHTRMRRLVRHAFSDSALREQEPLVHHYCNLLIKRLNEQTRASPKAKIDIMRWINFITFDIIGDLAFCEPFQALEKGVYHKWMATVFQSLKLAPMISAACSYPISTQLLTAIMKYVPAITKARFDHNNYTKAKVTRRLESKTDRKDFMSHILRVNDEKGLTHDEIVSNSAILILAGSETTATLLSGLIFLLLKNPLVLEKLTKEIREAFKSTEKMTFVEEAKMEYLNVCIQEALRIYPPSPGSSPLFTPPEGTTINGSFISGNTSVAVHPLSTFRSSRNFKDPLKFVPERWLGDEHYVDDDREALQPFGFGSHNCLGMRLAHAEMRSIMVHILWNFDMELCPDSDNWMDQKVFVLWDKPPLNVKLSSRFMDLKYEQREVILPGSVATQI